MSKGKILGVIGFLILAIVIYAGWYYGTSEHGKFSDWSKCDKECGTGIQTRTYTPKVRNGDDLPDKDILKQSCNTQSCPIDGVLSNWSAWSACDKPCGGGNQIKTRTYTSPLYGGRDLSDKDELTESKSCNTQPCVIDGKYNNWSDWGSCVKSQTDNTSINCGPGEQKRIRSYSQPMNGGNHHPDYTVGNTDIQNKLIEWQNCTHSTIPNCPINGSYNNWSVYGTCVKSQIDSTPITCGTGKKSRTRTYNAPLHRGSHHPDYTAGKTDLENKLIEWETCSNISRVCQPQNASCSSWTNDGNPFCNTTSNQYQIKQKRTYTPAIDGGADLTNTPDNNLCKTRQLHERTILARSDANIESSNGVCPANGIMTDFSTPINSNCTPATGQNRVQYLVATYTFPTSSANSHDSKFTNLGFSTSQINDIKNLTTTSTPNELTYTVNNIEYKIKRTNTTFPYIYEIKKKVSCSDEYKFSKSQIDTAWTEATGCTQSLNTTIYSQINTTENNLKYLNSIENDVKPTFNRFSSSTLLSNKNTADIKLCYGDNNNTGYDDGDDDR